MGVRHFLVAWRTLSIFIVLSGITAAPPAIAATPKSICRLGPVEDAVGSAPLVEQASIAAEAAIARRLAGDRGPSDIATLAVADGPAAPLPTAVRARYCAAAGELMRVDPGGNQLEARQFLIAAVNLARQTGDAGVEARAAYRLGLTLLGGDSVVAVRTRGAQQPAPAPDTGNGAASSADDPCQAIEAPVVRGAAAILARAALGCAAVRALEAGDADRAALARLRLARLLLAEIETTPFRAAALREAAEVAARQGLEAAQRIASPVRRATFTGRLAEAMAVANPASPEIASAIASMRADARGDAATSAFAAALEGRIALARGDRQAAAAALERAVFLEGQRSQPLRLPGWLLLLAEARPDRRATLVQQAYRALEAIRPILPLNDALTEESNFALQMRPVFEAAVAAQLADAGSDQTRIASVQRIVETYREAELQSAFGANCVPARDPVDPAALRAGEVLLYPILLDDRVELLFVSGGRDGTARFNRLATGTPLTRKAVAQLVGEMTSSLIGGGDDRWKDAARALYDLLIKPIEGRLKPGGTLVIVPDGPLRALPFAALIDGDDKYLIERTQIALAPALAYSQPGRDRSGRALKVVAVALQRDVDLPAGRFAKLEGTRDEALAAAGPGGTVIDDFREADLRRALARGHVDVLHLATHAAFNGRSDRSFIVANGEAIPLADLRGLIGDGRARGDDLDLLVLSACETAVGDDLASMGLAGAAVQSGADSAIASLWSVNDAGTVALMKGFYDRYRSGDGKAAALRQAQLALIGRGGDVSHPSIWAAFTLLGGWR
ncbi:MAG: CHAT domain-containing protein [Sphingomonas sp.]|nr:CHAT domain-containing protein [Sphingomonas sp.]